MITHLWPTRRPASLRRRGLGGVRTRSRAGRAAPQHSRLARPVHQHGSTFERYRVTTRASGREPDDLRPLTFTARDYTEMATGSVLVEFGRTRVLCTAWLEGRVPPWLKGSGQGLGHRRVLDAAGLVAASASTAKRRTGKQSGRTPGDPAPDRALAARGHRPHARCPTCSSPSTATCSRPTAGREPRRSAAAGSRCTMRAAGCSPKGALKTHPVLRPVAAISVGVIDGTPMLDLEYSEDVRAEVDMNVVMTGDGRFVEVQGTAEGVAFTALRARRAPRARRGRHPRDRRRADRR